jgi:hypothetical protein
MTTTVRSPAIVNAKTSRVGVKLKTFVHIPNPDFAFVFMLRSLLGEWVFFFFMAGDAGWMDGLSGCVGDGDGDGDGG